MGRGLSAGSRVYLRLDDGRTLMQEVKIGASFDAGNNTNLLFGLGDAQIVEMVVVWPHGRMAPHEDVEVNQMVVISR